MDIEAVNDFTYYRENHWNEAWPHVCSSPQNESSGYQDILANEYLPESLLNFYPEHGLTYPKTATVYRNYLHASTVAVVLYLAFIVLGQRFMRNRKPFGLKRGLAAWNLLLAVYSFFGTIRLVPHIVYGHVMNPPAFFVCRNAQGHSEEVSVYFWISLFIWSKYFELIDTVFLVLRKRPVNFLHWFHHSTVLLYTWHSMAHQTNTGIYFAGMNYFVHAIMYFYYFLAAVGKPPNWGLFVTILQITQMFVGIGINAFQYYASTTTPHCDVAWRNMQAAIVMYTAYMALFVQFFVERYCRIGQKRTRPATAKSVNGLKNGEHVATNGSSSTNGESIKSKSE